MIIIWKCGILKQIQLLEFHKNTWNWLKQVENEL